MTDKSKWAIVVGGFVLFGCFCIGIGIYQNAGYAGYLIGIPSIMFGVFIWVKFGIYKI